jgi:glycerol uptake operon antiterminator
MNLPAIPKAILACKSATEAVNLAQSLSPSWLFLLGGAASDVALASRVLEESGVKTFIHIDMVKGISGDAEGLRLLASLSNASGIISTHPSTIQAAGKLGFMTIQRVFLLDSASVESGIKSVGRTQPDLIELLPAVLPAQVHRLAAELNRPIITGGLVSELRDVLAALSAGALGVSMSSTTVFRECMRNSQLFGSKG